jgi:hypothetical protein
VPHGETGGHFVSAEAIEMFRAATECGDEAKAFNTATATFADAHGIEATTIVGRW